MATDQEIRDAGFKYIPQQKYLQSPFNIPTAPDGGGGGGGGGGAGIPYTNSGGDWSSGGNAFGYGTAVQPGDKSVITSGPYAGQSGYYNSINYTGGLPGDAAQKGPGRYFQYDNSGEFYKDYTIQPKKELPDWMKVGIAVLPGGKYALNFIDNKMNPGMTGMTAAEIDKHYGTGEGGGNYGIAGLSDEKKQYYDTLAGEGFLYDGPGGHKTLTGKNFAGKGYIEGQMELANQFGFSDMTDEEIEEAIEAEKLSQLSPKYGGTGKHNNPGFKYKQMLEASAIYKANRRQYENNLGDIGASNIDEAAFAGQGGDKAAQQQIAQQQQATIDQAYRDFDAGRDDGYSDGSAGRQFDSGGNEVGYNDPFDPGGGEKDGGFIDGSNRRPFFYGGLAGLL